MGTITKLLQLRKDQRGLSNIIVVVLSLLLIVIIVANVVLWSYQMNQIDWEKMRENITIVSVKSIIETLYYNPSGYTLHGATSWLSGNVSNLVLDDGVKIGFRSYYSGTERFYYVDDNTSDVDFSVDKGTHSAFPAQQSGPDGIVDTLTEYGSSSTDLTSKYAVTGSTSEITGALDHNYATIGKDGACGVTDYQGGIGAIKQVYFNITYYGTVSGTLAWAYQLDGGGWSNIENLPEGGSVPSPLTRTYNATNLRAAWTWNNLNMTDIQFQNNDDAGSENVYVDAIYVTVVTETASYQLDLEVQWANADFDETNEWLCIYGGTMGSEDVHVDVWYGGSWQSLFVGLSTGWNNISVTDFLGSSIFTIRFKDSVTTDDVSQDSWNVDATLLRVWSDKYASEVEFTGSSNGVVCDQLNWTVNTAWTIGSVSVTLQLYNYTLDGYPASGNGYIAYTSDNVPNTGENKTQTINSNPTHFRNATGHWKLKAKGVKTTDTQFDFKADWIEVETIKNAGTLINFRNEGAVTVHLVSLWTNNSTHHKRYGINLFANSGENISYTLAETDLSTDGFTVRVVTERGNIAVFSNH